MQTTSENNEFRQLISRKRLCQRLDCSSTTLWRKIRDGKIEPPNDVAGLERWTPEYVDSLTTEDSCEEDT